MSNWPKREDGSNKTVGEMTSEEKREVFKASAARLKAEFENPLIQEKLKHALNGGSVQ